MAGRRTTTESEWRAGEPQVPASVFEFWFSRFSFRLMFEVASAPNHLLARRSVQFQQIFRRLLRLANGDVAGAGFQEGV